LKQKKVIYKLVMYETVNGIAGGGKSQLRHEITQTAPLSQPPAAALMIDLGTEVIRLVFEKTGGTDRKKTVKSKGKAPHRSSEKKKRKRHYTTAGKGGWATKPVLLEKRGCAR